MTVYSKKLAETVAKQYPGASPEKIVEVLFSIGVIENTLAKVLAIREFVKEKMNAGENKLNSMWMATEIFACSYEYVRKCMYYYKDINL